MSERYLVEDAPLRLFTRAWSDEDDPGTVIEEDFWRGLLSFVVGAMVVRYLVKGCAF